jgi:hypothetical protein
VEVTLRALRTDSHLYLLVEWPDTTESLNRCTSSEEPLPAVRARIEETWGALAFDHAGTTEVGAYGYECSERAGLHVNESEFIAEVIDPLTGAAASYRRPRSPGLGRMRLRTDVPAARGRNPRPSPVAVGSLPRWDLKAQRVVRA